MDEIRQDADDKHIVNNFPEQGNQTRQFILKSGTKKRTKKYKKKIMLFLQDSKLYTRTKIPGKKGNCKKFGKKSLYERVCKNKQINPRGQKPIIYSNSDTFTPPVGLNWLGWTL